LEVIRKLGYHQLTTEQFERLNLVTLDELTGVEEVEQEGEEFDEEFAGV
jgi:hypothetical protein